MNKEDLFKEILPHFEMLFPHFKFTDDYLNVIYDVTVLDSFIIRLNSPDFKTLFWCRLYLNTFRAYKHSFKIGDTLYSHEIYLDIYDNIIKKFNPVNFKC